MNSVDSPILIDGLQFCRWSRRILEQMRESGMSAVHVTLAYHQTFRNTVANLMESLDRGKKGFGNGRTVRNIFEECVARQANRYVDSNGRIDVSMFEEPDIPKPGEVDFD